MTALIRPGVERSERSERSIPATVLTRHPAPTHRHPVWVTRRGATSRTVVQRVARKCRASQSDGRTPMSAKKVDSRGLPLRTYDTHRRVASTAFAAVLLIVVGAFHVVQGIAAIFSDGDFTTAKG